MSHAVVWTVVIGMATTNFLMRYLPMAAVSRVRLPESVARWLSFVPVAVMASIVTVAVLRPDGDWPAPHTNPYLLAALPTALVYRLTRSFMGATVVGVVVFLVLRKLLGA